MNVGSRLRSLAALWVAGGAALAAVTAAVLWFGVDITTAALFYLIVVVLLASFAVAALVRRTWRLREDLAMATDKAQQLTRTEEQLRYSENRYQVLLRAMEASFWEMDVAGVQEMIRGLRRAGVTDFRAYFKANPDFVREMMRVTTIVDINERTVAMFGGTREDLLGGMEPIWPEESTQHYAEMIAQSLDGALSGWIECKFRRRDGSLFDGHLTTAFPPRGYRKAPAVIGIIDITERKATEERLRYSEYRYVNIFGAMAASFWELDFSEVTVRLHALRKSGVADFRAYFGANPDYVRDLMRVSFVVDVNDETVKLFGHGDKQAMLRDSEPFWPEESTHVYAESILQRLAGKPNYSTECKLRRLDGTTFDALFTVAFPPEPFGTGTITVGVIDITQRKSAERARRISEQRYQNVFQAMAVSFWQLDYTRTNEMLRTLFASGVTDLRRHLAENPEYAHELTSAAQVVDVNERTVALFGNGRKEDLLTSPRKFWAEDSKGDYIEMILSSIETRRPVSIETRLRKLDGTVFPVEMTLMVSPDDRSSGLVGIIDITERKRAFEELERSEQRYRHLFHYMPMSLTQIDSSRAIPLFRQLREKGVTDLKDYLDENPDFLWELTDALVIEEVNEHNVKMFGAPNTEAMKVPITRFWRARPDTIRRSLESLYRGEAYYQEETQVVRFDGTTMDVLFSAARPTMIGKNLVGFHDVTALKQAHREIEQSEVRYRNLFHHMPIPLWRMDSSRLVGAMQDLRARGVTDLLAYMRENPDFLPRAMELVTVEEVNQSTVRLFGAKNAEELIGPVTDYWHASPHSFERILDARFRGEAAYGEQTKLTTRDGRILDGLFYAAFPEELSKVGMSLNTFVDATERVRAEEMLQRVQADFAHAARVSMLGELTASIAHEVNQPLAAIATNGEAGLRWINRAQPNLDEARMLLKRMVTDARRAADIIARVRNMATRSVHTRVPVSLHQVIDETLLFLGHEIQSRGVSVSVERAALLPDVHADRTQMQQVAVNLAVNAMQAIGQAGMARGRVAIRTSQPDRATVRCTVEDSGPGIEPANLDRLFESFFTTKEGGMGMGLAICRSIIEAHGGRIEAGNDSPLGGARFSFTLPVPGAGEPH